MSKKTVAQVKAEIAALEKTLVELGDKEAKKKQALIDIEEKLKQVNELLESCANLAKANEISFSWETPMGGTMEFDGYYWPDVDWNSSNCY